MSYLVPTVTEKTPHGERSFDIYSRLLKDRIVFLGTPIDDGVANVIMAQLLHLEMESDDKPINMYINSPGGSITALMAIYDTMQFIRAPVHTFCMGLAASAAAVLLAAGEPGKRFSLPHSQVMIHQPHVQGISGQATDVAIHAEEILKTRAELNQLLADHTGQTLTQIELDVERDKWFGAAAAKAYGLIDVILEPREKN